MKKVVVEIQSEIERNFHWQFIPSPVENNIQLSCGDFSFRGKKSYEIVDVTNCSREYYLIGLMTNKPRVNKQSFSLRKTKLGIIKEGYRYSNTIQQIRSSAGWILSTNQIGVKSRKCFRRQSFYRIAITKLRFSLRGDQRSKQLYRKDECFIGERRFTTRRIAEADLATLDVDLRSSSKAPMKQITRFNGRETKPRELSPRKRDSSKSLTEIKNSEIK
ncbi:hypothetical protein V1477_002453 [Vespula maculifrons]|uniref:Uncharacterized protein n=1 Tax=Vespula maculifrons TaxID=7453 RepID=A0ABD2CWJ3_VESMC